VSVVLEQLVVSDAPDVWAKLGFHVHAGKTRVGGVEIRLSGREPQQPAEGIVSWRLRDVQSTDLDGLRTEEALGDAPPSHPDPAHPNGALAVDHVVAFTGDFDRSVAALERAGLDLRRVRKVPGSGGVRQGFFLLGHALLELAGPVQNRVAATFWGLTIVVDDLDALAERLGDRLGEPRDAVQPGRRIATVTSAAGASVPLAFMTPRT
jgi:hypothetical protein